MNLLPFKVIIGEKILGISKHFSSNLIMSFLPTLLLLLTLFTALKTFNQEKTSRTQGLEDRTGSSGVYLESPHLIRRCREAMFEGSLNDILSRRLTYPTVRPCMKKVT